MKLQYLCYVGPTEVAVFGLLRATLDPRVPAPLLESVTPMPKESFWVRCRRTLTIRSASSKMSSAAWSC